MGANSCPHPNFPGLELCAKPYTTKVEITFAVIVPLIIVLVISLIIFACSELKKDKQAFRGSSNFLICLLFGSIFLLISVLFWPMNNTNWLCMTKPIFHMLGVVFMVGILSARVYKVWFCLVFRPKLRLKKIMELDRSKLTKWDAAIVVIVCFLVETLLLIILYSVEEYRPICTCINYTDSGDVYGRCNTNPQFAGIVIGFNLFPAIITGILAFLVLRQFSKHGEVLGVPKAEIIDFHHVANSMVAMLVFVLIAGILVYKQEDVVTNLRSLTALYVFRSVALILGAMVPALILHSSRWKLYRHRLKKDSIKVESNGINSRELLASTSLKAHPLENLALA